jgi:hypothetical protein
MLAVVAAAVAKVDTTHKRHIEIDLAGAPDDHQLLVVGADKANAHVEQHLSPGGVDDVA